MEKYRHDLYKDEISHTETKVHYKPSTFNELVLAVSVLGVAFFTIMMVGVITIAIIKVFFFAGCIAL